MDKQIQSIQKVTPIAKADELVFNKYFENNPSSLDYGNSWCYIVQSVFFGGYKYYDDKNLVSITTKTPGNFPIVITKYLGDNSIAKTAEIADKYVQAYNQPVIIKNLDKDEFDKFVAYGFRDYAEYDAWHKGFRYDDDTYPQLVVFLQDLIQLKGRKYKQLRYRVDRFKRENNHAVTNYLPQRDLQSSLQVLKSWTYWLFDRYSKEIESNPLLLHSVSLHKKFLQNLPQGTNGKDYFTSLVYVNKNPAAFALAHKISNECVGVYSNFSKADITGLAEFLVYSVLSKAYEAGYKYANLGGSEFKSLHDFKMKFKPIKKLQKLHAVLYPKN